MTLATDIILASTAVFFGILNAVQYYMHGRSNKKFLTGFVLAAAKAQKGDFKPLEDLLRACQTQLWPSMECFRCLCASKKLKTLISGTFEDATMRISFAVNTFSTLRTEAAQQAKIIGKAVWQQLDMIDCAQKYAAEDDSRKALVEQEEQLKQRLVSLEQALARFAFNDDVESDSARHSQLLAEKCEVGEEHRLCEERISQAKRQCGALWEQYNAPYTCYSTNGHAAVRDLFIRGNANESPYRQSQQQLLGRIIVGNNWQ